MTDSRFRRRLIRIICDRTEPAGTALALVDMLCAKRPHTVDKWMRTCPVLVAELRAVATEQHELSHDNLDRLGPSRSVEHLRQELIVAGLLPARHHQLGLFDQWTAQLLAGIDNVAHRHVIVTYATWHHRRRLATAIDNATLRPASTRAARRQIRVAAEFLDWLDRRQLTLANCSQADLDRWFSTGNTTRRTAVGFIAWARNQQLCRRDLRTPAHRPGSPTGIAHADRVTLIARLIDDNTIKLSDRLAGLLVALYAQPVTRISVLRRDAITISEDTGHVTILVGTDIIELAEPVARLARALLAEQADSVWLFPGRTPGQPRSSHSLGESLRTIGVTQAARVAALHDLVRQIPSPVLADLIGYNPTVIARRAVTLATPWDHYAALRATASSPF